LHTNQFYLGEEINFQIAIYVEMTHGLVDGEEILDDFKKDEEKVEEDLVNYRGEHDHRYDRLWEVLLNTAFERIPSMRDPDTEAYLSQDLQIFWHEGQRHLKEQQEQQEEAKKKFARKILVICVRSGLRSGNLKKSN
jgi:hypothetical protein